MTLFIKKSRTMNENKQKKESAEYDSQRVEIMEINRWRKYISMIYMVKF